MRNVDRRALAGLFLLAAALNFSGCGGGGGGGGSGPGGGGNARAGGAGAGGTGPAVVVSDGTGGARLSPYPDDRFTAADPGSPTGLRLTNLLLPTATDLERRVAADLTHLDGFGVLAPITVTFDDDLDLATVTDATVLVVNAEPSSARFGEVAPLDLGRGSYLTDLGRPASFYGRDPLAATGDMVYPPGNPGVHYEASSHTLVLRPLRPLEEGARHVVLLLDGLLGRTGASIAPPAGFVRPTAFDAALAAAGQSPAHVRFEWSFTTGTPTLELRAIADGLDGTGPLARPLAAFAPRLERFDDVARDLGAADPTKLHVGIVGTILGDLAQIAQIAAAVDPAIADFTRLVDLVDLSCVDYISTGSVLGPDLRTSSDETFQVNLVGGQAPAALKRTTFLLVVPKPCAENGYARPPYPILLSGHGNGRSRLDGLGIAAAATRHGWAVAAFDAVGHGPDDAVTRLPLFVAQAAAQDQAVEAAARAGILALSLVLSAPVNPFDSVERQMKDLLCNSSALHPFACDGLATDVDGSGYTESGATFFTADVAKTRDIVRQTAVSAMVLARVLRSGANPDVGGRVAYTGISLGGINGSVILGADPLVASADLMVPGGGFTDIVTNSSLESVTSRVMGEVFGEVILGDPDGAGGAFVDVDRHGRMGRLATAAGGRVTAKNARSGGAAGAAVAADGGFRVHLAADPGDPLEVDSFDAAGAPLGLVSFAAPSRGLGLERATPQMREWVGLAALALEAADPACYAPLWRRPPAGRAAKNVLLQISLGDFTVPVFTGATLGRAAGLVSAARNDLLIREGVLMGGIASNVDRAFGVESTRDAGIRFLGVDSHAGMLIPNPNHLPESAAYTAAAQRQAFTFLANGTIDESDPIFDVILPP